MRNVMGMIKPVFHGFIYFIKYYRKLERKIHTYEILLFSRFTRFCIDSRL